jgi:protein SCO1
MTAQSATGSGPLRKAAIALAAGALLLVTLVLLVNGRLSLQRPFAIRFALTGAAGQPVTQKDLRGHPYAMFFGYASCPDICPATLTKLVQARIAAHATDTLRIVFVSLDAEADTPADVAKYLAGFGPDLIGLTGTQATVRQAADSFGVEYRPGTTVGALQHTGTVFLVDRSGRLTDTIAAYESTATAADKLRHVIQL